MEKTAVAWHLVRSCQMDSDSVDVVGGQRPLNAAVWTTSKKVLTRTGRLEFEMTDKRHRPV